MRNYELTLLVASDQGEEKANLTLQSLVSFIMELGGLPQPANILEKRTLDVTIQKEREAYLAGFTFIIEEEKLEELKKKITQTKEILRHMLLQKSSLAKASPFAKAAGDKSVDRPSFARVNVDEPKIDIAEIDKKIEELTKEL